MEAGFTAEVEVDFTGVDSAAADSVEAALVVGHGRTADRLAARIAVEADSRRAPTEAMRRAALDSPADHFRA